MTDESTTDVATQGAGPEATNGAADPDLVIGLGHRSPDLGRRVWLPSPLHQALRVARRTRRARRALRAAGGVALVSRNFSACT